MNATTVRLPVRIDIVTTFYVNERGGVERYGYVATIGPGLHQLEQIAIYKTRNAALREARRAVREFQNEQRERGPRG